MGNKEKYINYVVDDLVSKTEIDYEQGKIKFPSLSPLFSSPFSCLTLLLDIILTI